MHVSGLRKTLGREAIATQAPGYKVVVLPGALDLDIFEALVANARGEDAERSAEMLHEALELWRGPALADLDDSIGRAERAQLEEEHVSAVEQRIDAELELGRHAELLPELEALVRQDPLRERRRAQLMLALYRSGRQAEALEVYRSGRKLLADELGLEPGAELRQLEKGILEQDPSLAAPALVAPKSEAKAEPAGRRRPRWPRLAVAAGAVLLASALVGTVLALTTGSDSVAVRPNSLAVLSPTSGKVAADVAIGGRPVSIAFGAGSVWVVNADEQLIVRIDPDSKRVLQRIGGLGSDLSDVAFGSGFLWVAGGNDGTLTRIDPQHNGARRIDLGKPGGPVFLVATGAGGVWVSRGNEVLRVDPGTSRVTAHVPVSRPQGIGVGPESAWVTSLGEHIYRIDGQSGRLVDDQDLSDRAFDPTVYDRSLWVTLGRQIPVVRRLDPGTLDELASFPFPDQFFTLAAGEGALWTADSDGGSVWRIDPRLNRVARLTDLPHHPVSVGAGFGSVWIGVQGEPVS